MAPKRLEAAGAAAAAAAGALAVVAAVVAGWEVEVVGVAPNNDPAGLAPPNRLVLGADVAGVVDGAAVVVVGLLKRLPADGAAGVVAAAPALPNRPPAAGAAEVAGVVVVAAAGVVVAGFWGNKPPPKAGVVELAGAAVDAGVVVPNKLGVDGAAVVVGFCPKRLPPAAAAGLGADGSGAFPKIDEGAAAGGCSAVVVVGVFAAAPPNKVGVEDGCEGWAPPSDNVGAPAGVVEDREPKRGLAGVAWVKSEPPAGAEVVGVNELAAAPALPPPPNRPPVVPAAAGVVEPPPKILDEVEAAPAGLPKREVPDGAPPAPPPKRLLPDWPPVAPVVDGAFPNNPPAPEDVVVAPPPKRLPPAEVPGLLVGVEPKRPPGLGASAGFPKRDVPVDAGVVALGAEAAPKVPKEKVGVPVAAPKREPEAGAVVEGVSLFDVGVELEAPNLKSIVSTRRRDGLRGLVRGGSKVAGI